MQRPTPDYSMLVVNEGRVPENQVMIDPPRRALVTTRIYSGETVMLELDVVAKAGPWLCVRQTAPGWDEWLAWIPAERCEPVR